MQAARNTTGGSTVGRDTRAARRSGRDAQSARTERPEARPPSREGSQETLGIAPGDRRVLTRLREQVGRELCDRYFERVAKLSMADGALRVRVPSDFVAGVIDRRFGEALRRACRDELGNDRVEYQVHAPHAPDTPSPNRPTETPPARPTATPRKKTRATLRSLDDFVVDASNSLAYNAARAVARGEGGYCPLFIHGSCGLGKTHLLQGIVRLFQQHRPGARALYVTSEAFTNAFLSSMRAGTLDAFRETYRGVELLCLDDVHFLSAKRATQTELLHTFDSIGMDHRLVVLASDEHPRDIVKLGASLASRFASGAVVRIDPPDAEMCATLVRHLAARRSLVLEDAAVELLVEHAQTQARLSGTNISVRDLEGLVIQIEATARLLPELGAGSGRIGAALASKALGLDRPRRDIAGAGARRPARIERIIELTCEQLGVSPDEFAGSHRHRRIVIARSLTVLLARELTNMSYPEIARAMHRPNHSTVITAHQRVQRQIDEGEVVAGEGELRTMTIASLAERLRRELAREARSC